MSRKCENDSSTGRSGTQTGERLSTASKVWGSPVLELRPEGDCDGTWQQKGFYLRRSVGRADRKEKKKTGAEKREPDRKRRGSMNARRRKTRTRRTTHKRHHEDPSRRLTLLMAIPHSSQCCSSSPPFLRPELVTGPALLGAILLSTASFLSKPPLLFLSDGRTRVAVRETVCLTIGFSWCPSAAR